MKIVITILAILSLTAFWVFQSRQNSLENTRAELKKLAQEIEVQKERQQEMRATPLTRPNPDQLQKLREARRDLIRLRGEHTRLATTKDWSLAELEEEVSSVEQRARSVADEGKLIQDMDEAEKRSGRIRGQLHSFVDVVHFLHRRGQKPQSLLEVKKMVESLPDKLREKQWFTEHFETDNIWHPISWKDCELVIVDDSNNFPESAMFYVTEKNYRKLPDGSISRIYAASQPFGFKEIRAPGKDFNQIENDFLQNLASNLFKVSNE